MFLESVGGDTDDFYVAVSEIGPTSGDFSKFGGANGGEITRMGEEDSPGVTNPFVEFNGPSRCNGFKIWSRKLEIK